MRSLSWKSPALQLGLLALLLITACVTINVYFPAAAAEKAADRVINEVLGPDAAKAKSSAPQSSLQLKGVRVVTWLAGQMLEFIVPSAHAQGADLNVDSPAVRQLTQLMKVRTDELKKYYDSGAIGFTKDGLIDVRDQNAIPLPERNAAKKLVSDENADRVNLYREIAKANNHPEWETDIRNTFAQRWVEKAASGWYVQDAGGSWKKK
ncbi:MAG: YdbL family protein [Steroidobacteraceae bacterium]